MSEREIREAEILPGGYAATAVVSEEALKEAEAFIEEEEGHTNRLSGLLGTAVTAGAVAMSLFHLYAAYSIVQTNILRYVHVGFMLVLAFLLFPLLARFRHRVRWWDVILAIASAGVIFYLIEGGDLLLDRASLPDPLDVWIGVILILLVLEATRRTTGLIMPVVSAAFIVYAVVGPWLPEPWRHRGYELDRLVGHLTLTLEGIFGVAIDVSATLIILFTIFGAVLQFSGAGKFFIDFALAVTGGRASSAGRTVVLSSFLLGGPSGSGVATTVTIGSVAWPMMRRAGYHPDAAGGLLAAGGMGAIMSPPVLGAAAFLIAEFLKISYFDVIVMAVVPTCLYYLSLLMMVEIDARAHGVGDEADVVPHGQAWALTKRYGFHFVSLISIIVFLVLGFSPALSVFWSTVVAVASSFLSRETALYPRRLVDALAAGAIQTLNIAATCASAGIIVGVVTLTGLGLKFSAIAIAYAGGSLFLTALYTALIVWVVGLAVPVTASYIICAVIAAPALTQLGVPDFAAHMFIFYYAVLSEVSPPTALSPFAAAAITRGNPYKTTLQSWKYTLPAFIIPFVFVLEPNGTGLLLNDPRTGGALAVVEIIIAATLGTIVLAAAAERYALRHNTIAETGLLLLGGMILMLPSLVEQVLLSLTGAVIPVSPFLGLLPVFFTLLMQRARPMTAT